MSFICDNCGRTAKTHEKPVRVITKKRERIYPIRREDPFDLKSKVIDRGGIGWDIAEEKQVCSGCNGK